MNVANLARYHKNPNTKEAHKRASYKHRLKSYGVSPEQYEVMWDSCQGACMICKVVPEGLLHLDHCHKTGAIRGLLCSRCNRVLGQLKDDLDVISGMKKYLEAANEINSS